MSDKSLYDTIAGFFGGGGGEPPTPKEREMVMSPPPPKPVQKSGEDNIAFSMRMHKWNMEMEKRRLNPSDFLVATEEVPPPERDRFDRRRQIEEAIDAND